MAVSRPPTQRATHFPPDRHLASRASAGPRSGRSGIAATGGLQCQHVRTGITTLDASALLTGSRGTTHSAPLTEGEAPAFVGPLLTRLTLAVWREPTEYLDGHRLLNDEGILAVDITAFTPTRVIRRPPPLDDG